MKIQMKQQKELQTLRIINNGFQNKCDKVMGTEVKLRKELKGVKVANENLKKYGEWKVKECKRRKSLSSRTRS
jgi:hypothetical protein